MMRVSHSDIDNNVDKHNQTVEPSFEAMHTSLHDYSQTHALKSSPDARFVNSSLRNAERDTQINDQNTSTARGWRSDNETDEGTFLGFSSDCSNYHNQKAPTLESFTSSTNFVNNEASFSIDDQPYCEKEGNEKSDTLLSCECVNDTRNHTPDAPTFVKSRSLSNINTSSSGFGRHIRDRSLAPRSRSSEDLHVLDTRHKETRNNEIGTTEKVNCNNSIDDGYGSCSGLTKDWVLPVSDEVNVMITKHQWDELPSKDFKTKRIEEWISNLQHCSTLEETTVFSQFDDKMKVSSNFSRGSSGKLDAKVNAGTEVARRYLCDLSAASTSAQLANHGLVVIPSLGAFLGLRVLNLSGNAIVKITAAALPWGLQKLNLSKNNIATIEGLRGLTRLRVLNLSYNRITRIGHGLASCSALKELYLTGNKISEIDGLHRLSKLSVLDLSLNKISTSKCLGQLGANSSSMQAISLEGNPAQKIVGDEQLRKCLLGLLPYLAYYNRKPTKVGNLKDIADRSIRLGIGGTHQFDSGSRPDQKVTRKRGDSLSAKRSLSTLTLGPRSQEVVSFTRPTERSGRLPRSGSKTSSRNCSHYFDFTGKVVKFKSGVAIRRNRSEGTLAVI